MLTLGRNLGDSIKLPTTPLPDMEEPDWNAEPYGDDETEIPEPFEADLVDAAGKPIMMHSLTDAMINAEVLLSKDDATAIAKRVSLLAWASVLLFTLTA